MIACLVLSCTLGELQAEINGEQLREALSLVFSKAKRRRSPLSIYIHMRYMT